MTNKIHNIPIFIVGCQRSGTSLLRRLLDLHSRIASPPETNFFMHIAQLYENERCLMSLQNMGLTENKVLDVIGEITNTFLTVYMKINNKQRWAEKTPHNVNHLRTIDKAFRGKVQYIAIVRDGLDVAYSLQKFDWGILTPYLEESSVKEVAAIRFWADQVSKIITFKKEVGERMFLLTYEKLTQSPVEAMKDIFDFLDETYEDVVSKYGTQQHSVGFEDPTINNYKQIVCNSGNYKKWSILLQQQLYSEAKDIFEELGYKKRFSDVV